MDEEEVEDVTEAGSLVTVDKETYAYPHKFFDDAHKTMYPWDNVLIKPGTIGIVLGFVKLSVCFAKIMWTIDGEGVLLYTTLEPLKVLNCKKDNE
jgi:hypothetical protein